MTANKRFPTGIMGTCCVPWDDAGRLAEESFRRNVRRTLRETPLVYIFGTAGEGYAVTDRQFDQVAAIFADEMRRGGAAPMVGIISLSLGTILERIERCRDAGIQRFQISLPSWGGLKEVEVFHFFAAVCGRFPDCQFMHYNLPRANRIVTGKEYGRLANEHPNLVATKNCSDSLSHISSLLLDAAPLQHFLSEAGYVFGSLLGECGILASLIMNWPRLRQLHAAGQQHDVPTLAAIHRETRIVVDTLWECVPTGRIDGSYDKLYEKLYDPATPLTLLPPYVGSSDDEFRHFAELLRQRIPTWLPAVDTE